jgi:hypothetical protein
VRDPDEVFEALKRSSFRSRFKLGEVERRYLRGHGLDPILGHAKRFISDRLAAAEPVHDGKQTPMRGHPAFIAQHATGTCCRSCVAKWHGIAKGRKLTGEEQAYILAVIERWLRGQGVEVEGADGQQRLF